jgi:hypothetical protein
MHSEHKALVLVCFCVMFMLVAGIWGAAYTETHKPVPACK